MTATAYKHSETLKNQSNQNKVYVAPYVHADSKVLGG